MTKDGTVCDSFSMFMSGVTSDYVAGVHLKL